MKTLLRSASCFAIFYALVALDVPAAGGAEKAAKKADPLPRIAAKVAGMEKRAGFLDLYFDRTQGRIWLELPEPQADGEVMQLIYYEGLLRGLGSNPVGLDRGQLGDGRLLSIRRIGPKVLFEQPNLRYRALSKDLDERRATAESFATSVIWGQEIAALDPSGRALVDLTSFLVRDAHNVVRTLEDTGQGKFKLDPSRSAVDFENCAVFPDNVELEALVTFAGDRPGRQVASIAPVPDSVTLIKHHSLIRLPPDGYEMRRFDPRVSLFELELFDYAAGLDEPTRRQFIIRHRLEKIDPQAERSRVENPIVYYVDRGAPEPVRSALVEGAGWWREAFEKAGFIDAFRVELLPEGAHPLDVRYNVIQWVHRATRGWSYGGGIFDPRTGEMLKGHVSLGSLRVRQDRLLFEGLLGVDKTGSGESDDPIQIALARIRQLAAHEIGHALGFGHNFAASSYGRASVMDYPAPMISLDENGELDFSQAYAVGVGEWDVHCVRYAYSQFPPGTDEDAALAAIVREGIEKGYVFLADDDTRTPHASDPRSNVWDNGGDPVAGLELALRIRRLGLDRFGEHNIALGRPLAELEEVLVPVYFHHRYQLDAAAKMIGGMEYSYAVRGDGRTPTRIVDAEHQRHALEVILGILTPEELDLPEPVLELLAPRPYESSRNAELFVDAATLPAFDALGAAATAAGQVVDLLLEPHRMARLVDFHRRQPSVPSLEEVLAALIEHSFGPAHSVEARHAELERVIERVVVERLLERLRRQDLPFGPRIRLDGAVRRVGELLAERGVLDGVEAAHRRALEGDIQRFLERREEFAPTPSRRPAPLPPGSPIGSSPRAWGWLDADPGCAADRSEG